MKKGFIMIGALVLALSFGAFAWVLITEEGCAAESPKNAETLAATCANSNLDMAMLGVVFNRKQVDFHLEIGSRFYATVTKEELRNASSATEIVPKDAEWETYPVEKLTVALLEGEDPMTAEDGGNLILTARQKELLQSMDYSYNFRLTANCGGNHRNLEHVGIYDLVYYITVVPEKQAVYLDGKEALINYLQRNSWAETAAVQENELKSGKLHFVVNADGTRSNVRVEATSGYQTIDELMILLIENAPGKWEPATDAKGQKVSQELVLSFGMVGC